MAKTIWIWMGFFLIVTAANAAAPMANAATENEPPGAETIAALRARGPEGLAKAVRNYDLAVAKRTRLNLMCRVVPPEETAQLDGEVEAWRAAVDEIGSQRGCTTSRLYWHTDLAAAKDAAQQTGRPILSLRMLGKLTDEYSCANSRFFRTALYANKDVSNFLRDNFVLHWQSVRPVPRVTIDFGDGRKLERTVTGNSAHYALTREGTPLDVLPGLYSPHKFLSWLEAMRELNKSCVKADKTANPAGEVANVLKKYHQARRAGVLREWDNDLQKLGDERAKLITARVTLAMDTAALASRSQKSPSAKAAAGQAVAKTAVEWPLLRFANMGGQWLEKGMDEDLWRAVANLHRDDVKLDDRSVELMRAEVPAAAEAGQLATTKQQQKDPILRLTRTFENSIALDTVRNEYLLHRRVHEKLGNSDSGTMELAALNEWVYAELFLTPSSDPWLGLAPTDVYTALDGNGQKEATQ